MCWACEEQDLWLRYEMELAVARGVIPEGFTAADFEAVGLPVPGQAQDLKSAKASFKQAGGFVCDAPADTPADTPDKE
jgi:hypothetical protein